jgi:8-oxo-dGTP diphosphatase
MKLQDNTMSQRRETGRGLIIHEGKLILMERWRNGLHYFSIPGGGVDPGETPEAATHRELYEELGISVKLVRKVYEVYTTDSVHHIYLCEYTGGEPALHPASPEAADHAKGDNRFKPGWVDINTLDTLPFQYWEPLLPYLVHDLKHGFSVETKTITV